MSRLVPGILIAGVTSGAGKTTVSAGIMGALRRKGLAVQPFKVGPDYIDPSYHTIACGRPSRNLDSWMVSPPVMRELYRRATASADIAVVEGVMGMFDGRTGRDGTGSSAEVAKLLGLPVLLVMDVSKMARSAGAMALGFTRFDPEVRVAGVIANNVGSPTHLRIVEEAIQDAVGLPVVGHLPRRSQLHLPERHLGLIPTAEGSVAGQFFDILSQQVQDTVDLEAIRNLAAQAMLEDATSIDVFPAAPKEPIATIAVARDQAFCFYYQDNLDLLSDWGARLVYFSPLRDRALPRRIQGLYLGGGFPELFAAKLSANRHMLQSIRAAHSRNLPIYAECGGLMYLCQSVANPEGQRFATVGLVPSQAVMRGRRVSLGYAQVKARRDTVVLSEGQTARGHEFHWSTLEPPLGSNAPYEVLEDGRPEGYQQGNLLASYVHLHFASRPGLAANFVANCARWGAGA